MLGNKPQYTTDNPAAGTSFGLGEAKGTHKGFTENVLPDPDTIWNYYYNNVLRGDSNGFENMTFSVPSSTGKEPPEITAKAIDGNKMDGGMGDPLGGMQPTIASPGEGNGVNPTAIPSLDESDIQAAAGDNGSITNPKHGSIKQLGQSNSGTGRSPTYRIVGQNNSLAAWSD